MKTQSIATPFLKLHISRQIALFSLGFFVKRPPAWCRTLILILILVQAGFMGVCARGAEISEVSAFSNYFNPSTLVLGADEMFYGTAGGAVNTGMVFRVTADGTMTQFAGLSPAAASPFRGGPLTQDGDGNLYGTALTGGKHSYGSVFKVATTGQVTLLVSFNGTNGAYPEAGLIFGSDGNLYGTTTYGGSNYRPSSSVLNFPGTVYRVSTGGQLTTLGSFDRTNGASPSAPLIFGKDGHLYGTTVAGGPSEKGTIFRVSTNGTINTLFAFAGANGAAPYSSLIEAENGTLFGTTARGGDHDYGTVFSLTTNAVFATLASFDGTNGAHPFAGLVSGSDGALYGTTAYGGSGFDGTQNSGFGTVFRLRSNGSVATLGSFGGGNGAHSFNALVQGRDGYLYGTCSFGGSGDDGSVFRVANRVRLQIDPQPNGDRILRWNALEGFVYQLQSRPDLISAAWSNLGSSCQATNAFMSTVDSTFGEAQRWYRVIESE